jgi:hypothetical protein
VIRAGREKTGAKRTVVTDGFGIEGGELKPLHMPREGDARGKLMANEGRA